MNKIIIKGCRQHNLKNIDLEIPRDKLVVITGLVGLGKIVPRLRYHLRRRTAPVRREPLCLRPPVPGPDGQARRGLHRRPLACHRHRAEDHEQEPPLHRRHGDRGLRLPAPALCPHRQALLLQMRQGDRGPDRAADHRRGHGPASKTRASRSSRPSCAAGRANTKRSSWPRAPRAMCAPGWTA